MAGVNNRGRKNTPKTNLAKTLGRNKDICPICENACQRTQAALQCESCQQWVHAECEGYTEEEYKLATKKTSLKYYCKTCATVKTGEGAQNTDLKIQLAKLTEIMQGMAERMKRMEETQTNVQDIEKKIEDMVNAKVEDALKEAQEKQQRKLNLVIVNIKESSLPIPAEARVEDTKRVESLLRDIIPEEEEVNLKISNPVRLGKQNAGTAPRLLRVTVPDEKTKRVILKNAQKLNKPGMVLKEMIWINQDYTEKERKHNKEMRDLLKEKQKEGGDWKIDWRNGKVVPKEPAPRDGEGPADA